MQEIKALKSQIQNQVSSFEIKSLMHEFKGLKEDNLKKIIKSSGILEQLSKKITREKISLKSGILRIQMGTGYPNNVKLYLLLGDQRVSAVMGNGDVKEFNFEFNHSTLLHAVIIKEDEEILGVGEINLHELHKLETIVNIKDLYDDQILVGVLKVDTTSFYFLDSKENFKLKREIKVKEEKYKAFVTYAKKWWSEFLQIRSSHSKRLVKIFVNSERGKTVVSSFIFPIRETVKHAARFTSLIPFQESQERALLSDVWPDLHTFLSLGKGSAIEHALLLCNLFLGFSLEAFVTLGLDSNHSSKAWITVLTNDKPEFWDPLSGSIISENEIFSLGCLFNNYKFYANISPLESPKVNLSDSSSWKELDLPVQNSCQNFKICKHPLSDQENSLQLESDIRKDLIQFIKSFRSNHSLDTVICEELSWIQSQTLFSLEMSKLLSTIKEMENLGIKSKLQPGDVYRGHPIQVNFLNSYRLFSVLLESQNGRKLILKGSIRLGVSVKIYFYGESSLALWVLVGAIYPKELY